MIARILVAAMAAFIAACASSGPDASAPADPVPVAQADAAAPEGEIYDLDAPDVETTASVAPEDRKDDIVCRREIVTGTKMSQRVCRKRSDIEAAEDNSQGALRQMRKSGSQLEKGSAN